MGANSIKKELQLPSCESSRAAAEEKFMPELPEVETIRCGLEPHVVGRKISDVILRNRSLRWPVHAELAAMVRGRVIQSVERRAKYLLLRCDSGSIILHLGMSGRLRILPAGTAAGKHDHADIIFDSGACLRFCDPRRFGALLWTSTDPLRHPLLIASGPEPLSAVFSGDYLYEQSRRRKISIKQFIMDHKVVCGVGNIYASEALFLAGINPLTAAGKISRPRCRRLAAAIKKTLKSAIAAGGTTLRDFQGASGDPGYFQRRLRVYGRSGEPCYVCGRRVRSQRSGQRSTFYCPQCQR
jgi:formamidopyrimidine-DNA glycosylase